MRQAITCSIEVDTNLKEFTEISVILPRAAVFLLTQAWPSLDPMSAIGPQRTSLVAPHMSAFGGKADMAFRFL